MFRREMASTNGSAIAFLAVFLLLCQVTTPVAGDLLSPLLSPIVDSVCKEVICGKGTCKASANCSFFFQCDCDTGWRQSLSSHDDSLKFLPCVVPNCTLDFSCTKAPSPVQHKRSQVNDSIFDPCFWSYCGGGSCNRTSLFTHDCVCSEGYYNLLNVSAFPCFEECAIGLDCNNLGIPVSNTSSSPPAGSTENTKNQAGSVSRANLRWLRSLMMTMIMALLQCQ